ncbi:unnamed protein product [Clonostachys solani]|uniref:Major facilitator superfamily (MFS) profile domain-containing protein n=1 Tax=Clonostachys solani TaxID=160281 RepID=A0A9N9VU62_9HYPO|nr:unnamed protein product [Clonostachys solani]
MSDSASRSLALDTSLYLSGWRLHIVIACLFFGSFLIALDTNIINVALPKISSDFESLQDVAWYGSAYLLTITAFQPVYGSMYTYFRTDVVYRVSISIFEVGSILCATAVNSPMFIVGRAIAGFGAAGILQGALSIISQVVPLEKRPLYMGVVISVFVIAVTVGPVLGGVFTQHTTWRWCFWINLPIGAVVLAGLYIFLKIRGQKTADRSLPLSQKLRQMDVFGALIFTSCICCLVLALQWGGQTKPWKSADVIGCLNVFFLPFWFQGVRGVNAVTTGVNFIPLLLPQLVSLIVVGAVVKQFGYYVPYMVVGELICIGGQVMLTQLERDSSTLYWAASFVVSGLGSGMAMQLPYTAVALVLSDTDVPVGNAIAVLFYQLGGAIFISMGQTVIITTILDLVPKRLPGIPAEWVVAVGAANLGTLAQSQDQLLALQEIWNVAIRRTMILSTAVVGAAVPFTLGMEWLNALKVAEERKNIVSSVDGESENRPQLVPLESSSREKQEVRSSETPKLNEA